MAGARTGVRDSGGGAATPERRAGTDPRRRRTAEEARTEILDAAERRMVAAGPAGIRLQEVAADVGVSHPTVLHHFGSREALVREVCDRRFAAIQSDVVRAIQGSSGGAEQVGGILDAVHRALDAQGHGRAVFWMALEGLKDSNTALRLHEVGLAAQALRARQADGAEPPLEDTLHVVALGALALLAESVIGEVILRDTGLGDGPAAGARFRGWLARLLADHLARTSPGNVR